MLQVQPPAAPTRCTNPTFGLCPTLWLFMLQFPHRSIRGSGSAVCDCLHGDCCKHIACLTCRQHGQLCSQHGSACGAQQDNGESDADIRADGNLDAKARSTQTHPLCRTQLSNHRQWRAGSANSAPTGMPVCLQQHGAGLQRRPARRS